MNFSEKIIAHRGVFDNKVVAENTIPAFKDAISFNYPFELDVQLTSDKRIVVFHDDTINRLVLDKNIGTVNIQKSTYKELKSFKLLNTNEVIPLLSDVLKINNDKVFVDIEVKPTNKIGETITYLMKELDGYQNYSIKSFDPRIVRYVKKNYPSVKVGLLISHKYDNFIYNIVLPSSFALKYSLCDFVSISKEFLKDKKFMRIISNYPISIWTILSVEDVNYSDNYIYICNNLPYKK